MTKDNLKEIVMNKENPIPVSKQNIYNIKIPYEYPFSMSRKDLKESIGYLIKQYNLIYASINPFIYIYTGEHQNGKESTIEDLSALIERGNNELSRRTNNSILIASFVIAFLTLLVATVSCVTTIHNS